MKIDEKRLISLLESFKETTATPGNGVTRFSYSREDKQIRERIKDIVNGYGCYIIEDQLGNLRIGAPSNVPGRPVILCGSHIDTVLNGGWLDGIYGTVSALEILLDICENKPEMKYNYEVVIFAEEEGSNFGSCMTGSKFLTGIYGEKDLDELKNHNGVSLRQMLGIEKLKDGYIWDLKDIKGMYELHIEQGPVLDAEGIQIGLVDSICGMRVVEVTVNGVGNHAGATPMPNRYDALTATAECILAAESTVTGGTVSTVGSLDVSPCVSNVIPETVVFSLEVRDRDEKVINKSMDAILEKIKTICENRGVGVSVREHSSSLPIYLDKEMLEDSAKMAKSKGIKYKVMPSGAVHDAAIMAPHVPTTMIFVPSIDGRSHVPEEDTKIPDLITGTELLADILMEKLKA